VKFCDKLLSYFLAGAHMKTTQPSPDASKAFHSNEMMGKKMREALAWVVDKFDLSRSAGNIIASCE
jgi:hypothetical protein